MDASIHGKGLAVVIALGFVVACQHPVAPVTASPPPVRSNRAASAPPVADAGSTSAAASCPDAAETECMNGRAHACECPCARGSTDACAALGFAYAEGRDVPVDPVRAAVYLERGCASDRSACARLGAMLASGADLPQDLGRAAAFDRRGCDGGVDTACLALGDLVDRGVTTLADPMYLVAHYDRVSGWNHEASWRLALRYDHGTGGLPHDETQALGYYRGACSLSPFDPHGREACARAGALAGAVCAHDDPDACAYAAAAAIQGGDPRAGARLQQRARALAEAACTHDQAEGCAWIAHAYEYGEEGVTQDGARAQRFRQRASALASAGCNASRGRDCLLLAMLCDLNACDVSNPETSHVTAIRLRGVESLAAQCQGGDGAACASAVDGLQGQDTPRIQDLAHRGCVLHDANACRIERRSR